MAVISEETERAWRLDQGDEIAPGLHALERLGGGHRYEAYLAFDDRLHAIVVAKVVRPHLADDAHTLEGLAEEAAMLDRLAHPVLVRGFGAVLEGPRPHIVLEHIEGGRLSTLIRRHGPLPPEQLIPLATQLCSVLHYLAGERVVHLDVKPANVIMSGPPRLIDLSVVRELGHAALAIDAIGTDGYMAPEQCDPVGLGPVGPQADVWGLGVTLYRAASGERPFPKGDPEGEGVVRWPQIGAPPAPLEGVPEAVAAPIMSCLARDPAARATPAALAEMLAPVLGSQPKPRLAALKPRWR